ncbi:MAG TPA: hypothetical protein VI685_03665 [Candidatus Angelobacter sp.]
MRYWVLALFLLTCLAAPFAGQTDQWQRYRNDGGNFSVLVAGQPNESVSGEGAQASHTIQAISGSIGYTIVYVVNPAEQPVDEPTFQIYRDAFLKGLPQCNLAKEDATSRPLTGYVGRWYRMDCDIGDKKMSFIGNLYWGKHYAYAVLAMFPSASSDPPEAAKFYNSFSVLDASK